MKKDIDDEIAETEEKLKKLYAQRTAHEKLTPTQRLAGRLHSLLCHWNHTDGCSWEYEKDSNNIDKWDGNDHRPYFAKAESILLVMDEKTANKFIDALERSHR